MKTKARISQPSKKFRLSLWFHGHTGEEFYREINDAYETIVHWQKDLFMIPSGKAGKEFITELSSWLNKFNNDTPFQSIALKVYMILPSFLLQKPSKEIED